MYLFYSAHLETDSAVITEAAGAYCELKTFVSALW